MPAPFAPPPPLPLPSCSLRREFRSGRALRSLPPAPACPEAGAGAGRPREPGKALPARSLGSLFLFWAGSLRRSLRGPCWAGPGRECVNGCQRLSGRKPGRGPLPPQPLGRRRRGSRSARGSGRRGPAEAVRGAGAAAVAPQLPGPLQAAEGGCPAGASELGGGRRFVPRKSSETWRDGCGSLWVRGVLSGAGREPSWRQNDWTVLQITFSLKRLYHFNQE